MRFNQVLIASFCQFSPVFAILVLILVAPPTFGKALTASDYRNLSASLSQLTPKQHDMDSNNSFLGTCVLRGHIPSFQPPHRTGFVKSEELAAGQKQYIFEMYVMPENFEELRKQGIDPINKMEKKTLSLTLHHSRGQYWATASLDGFILHILGVHVDRLIFFTSFPATNEFLFELWFQRDSSACIQ